MSGHSPAPWQINDEWRPADIEAANSLKDAEGQYFATLWFHGLDTDAADARLIAASPRMYEAVSEAFENCEQCSHLGCYDVSRCARCKTFRKIMEDVA